MGAEENKGDYTVHHISLKNREAMEITGVTDVISFDDQSVILNTVCGNMEIDGASLHIHILSMEQGTVTLDGRIDSVTYYEEDTSEKSSKRGLFGKIFR